MKKKTGSPSNNPLIESMAEIKRLEFNDDIKIAYKQIQKDLGDSFNDHMKIIAEEIVALQKLSKKKITYYIAGFILTMPPDENDVATEEELEDFKYYVKLVRAATGWGILNGYSDSKNSLMSDLTDGDKEKG